jgi:hypothetical protein
MIGIILDMLALDDFHNVSEEIEIAKGKHKIPKGFKEIFNKAKRKARWSPRQ